MACLLWKNGNASRITLMADFRPCPFVCSRSLKTQPRNFHYICLTLCLATLCIVDLLKMKEIHYCVERKRKPEIIVTSQEMKNRFLFMNLDAKTMGASLPCTCHGSVRKSQVFSFPFIFNLVDELLQTQADPDAISKMYPTDYCNLTEFFEFPCESISVSCNFASNIKILSNSSSR